jgi:hypothetical protein
MICHPDSHLDTQVAGWKSAVFGWDYGGVEGAPGGKVTANILNAQPFHIGWFSAITEYWNFQIIVKSPVSDN